MGFWKKLGGKLQTGVNVAAKVVPALPLPSKLKRIVSKVDKVEDDVSSLVEEFKHPDPPKPAA